MVTPRSGSGSLHDLGETGGSETVTLLQSEMPFHPHTMRAATVDPANVTDVNPDASWSVSQNGPIYQSAPNGQMAPEALALAGGDGPHNNLMPYITFYFNIALQGVFPPRG